MILGITMSNHNDDGMIWIVVLVVAIAALSSVLGVDMRTGAEVAGLLVLFIVIAIAVRRFTRISLRKKWYVLPAFLWLACIPAFNFHAEAHRMAALVEDPSFWDVWYGSRIVQVVVPLAILGGGFFVQKKIEES
jgi:hypothetical protein